MANNEQNIREFLADEVNLNQTRIDQLNQHHNGLEQALTWDPEKETGLKTFQTIEKQGSFALGTAIRPTLPDAKVDADLLVLVDDIYQDHGRHVKDIYDCLLVHPIYYDKVEIKDRAVTVTYSEPTKITVDLVPCITRNGKRYTCPISSPQPEVTGGAELRDWFNGQTTASKGHLKRVVRLIKWERDHVRKFNCESVIITALAGQAINHVSAQQCNSTQETLVLVLEQMAKQISELPYPLDIPNPAFPEERLKSRISQKEFVELQQFMMLMAQTARRAHEEKAPRSSLRCWKNLFGEKFSHDDSNSGGSGGGGSSQGPSGGSNPAGGAAATPTVITPRRQWAGPTLQYPHNPSRMRVSNRDLKWLKKEQPGLVYDQSRQTVAGTLFIDLAYCPTEGHLLRKPPSDHPMRIIDSFQVSIELTYNPGYLGELKIQLPPVKETGGRWQKQAAKGASLADLHIFPDTKKCCLTIEPNQPETLRRFIQELVEQWFYRFAYVERYGVKASQDDLWPTFSHDASEALQEYYKTQPVIHRPS